MAEPTSRSLAPLLPPLYTEQQSSEGRTMATWGLCRAWGVALLALVSLLLVSADARAGCAKDTDCKGDRLCRAGECVDSDEPQSCEMDTDCPGDEVCKKGACQQPGATEPMTEPPPAPTPVEPPAAAPQAPAPPPLPPPPPSRPEGRCASDLDCAASESCESTVCTLREERRSSALMAAGIVMVSAGAIAGGMGAAIAAVLDSERSDTCKALGCSNTEFESTPGAPIALWVGGGTVLVTGVVFLVYGAPKVAVEPEGADTAATIEPFIGLMGGGLRGTF